MPVSSNPLVSIIIPVYNQFEYTESCLRSIYNHTQGIEYEVIVADDASTDETSDISKRIPNVIHLRNQANLRFLRNCNSATQAARGKYLLFLNNDTQVQPNWLSELLDVIEHDESIGMVGSKLVYPDGMLQEAGGIVFSDGSAMNYGRGRVHDDCCAAYRKDVDYISGASIMIRRDLWERLGGFDERFAPAYYEDTDLAFSVRAAGLRVVYVPSSVVIHFEGKTNGTDLTSGQKQYQLINREKFYKKWKEILITEQARPADLFTARDRSAGKKVLLFIDEQILTPDQDCGSRASFTYLKLFAECGFNVKFMPRIQHISPEKWRYCCEIGKMGVEVIMESHVDWFRENGRRVDYVYLNRPGPADELLPLVKKYTCAKVLYQGHDLHHWRMQREYELHPDEKLAAKAEEMKAIETAVFTEVDCTFMFSDVEVGKIRSMLPYVKADSVPLFVMNETLMDRFTYKAEEREGLMFVAGFGHPPNADGILWFMKEVWPLVLAKFPSMVISIAGSSMTKTITSLSAPNVRILGRISDEELDDLYKKVRVSIVPLRYGAGVKGKVVEALFHKIPVVTTPIGAEGIPTSPLVTVEKTAEMFASSLVSLYQDTNELNSRSKQAKEFIRLHFSREAVHRKLDPWFDFPKGNSAVR